MSLSDQELSEKLNRTKQAIYCKRWAMGLYKKKRTRTPKLHDSMVVSGDVIQKAVNSTIGNSVERVVLGNVTIDLVSKTLTVHF